MQHVTGHTCDLRKGAPATGPAAPSASSAGPQAPPVAEVACEPPHPARRHALPPVYSQNARLNFLRTSYRSVFAFLFTRLFYFLSVFPKTEVPRGQKLCPLSPANSKLSN